MTGEPEEDAGGSPVGEPPAIVLYAIYATLVAVLIAVLVLVGIYV